jgi:hypothetical protein
VQSSSSAVERFSALTAILECRHAFIGRIPGIEVSYDKAEVLARLDAAHREIRTSLSMDRGPLLTAQQVHGDRIAVIDQPSRPMNASPNVTASSRINLERALGFM